MMILTPSRRSRRSVISSAVLITAALLAGCTAGEAVLAAPEVAAPVDLCALAAPAGAASDGIQAEGPVGAPAAARFTPPLTITSTERSVLVEGDGAQLDASSLVDYAVTIFDAATGEQLDEQGYDGAPALPTPAASAGTFLGCATVGSRLAVAVPETDQGGPTVWVLDVLDTRPSVATGEEQQPVAGMPEVTVADSGAPGVAIPDTAPPAETEVAVLKKGDGATVAPGDSVLVQYLGVRWSNGEVFDSTWSKGAPTSLVTTDVITGYRPALEGQTIGSQILAVIPPEFAYGAGEINEDDLAGETLVFVVDILASAPTR